MLGAVQLSALPWLGFVSDDVSAAPPAAVGRLARQLGLAVADLAGYGEREQTRTDHTAPDSTLFVAAVTALQAEAKDL